MAAHHAPPSLGFSRQEHPVQGTSNWLELCYAWVAIWLLFLCNPPLSASFPQMWITHHSLAPQPLSTRLLLKTLSDTYVPGSASSWLPSVEGQMIRMHPGYPETTPGLSTGKLILLPNIFYTTICKRVFYLSSLLREMKEVAWGDWPRV